MLLPIFAVALLFASALETFGKVTINDSDDEHLDGSIEPNDPQNGYKSVIIEEGSNLMIHCSRTEVINVISAKWDKIYDRPNWKIVPLSSSSGTDHSAHFDLVLVRLRCQGRNSCTHFATQKYTNNMAPDYNKYLKVQYMCVPRGLVTTDIFNMKSTPPPISLRWG